MFPSFQYYRLFCANSCHLIPVMSISVPGCNSTYGKWEMNAYAI